MTPARARTPRALHPLAWWVWAIGLATAASRTTNPLLLVLILAVAGFVVSARRTDAPWARAFHYYLLLGLSVIAIRVVFRSLLGTDDDPAAHVLVRLPRIPLPHWAAGVQLGGPVTWEGTVAAGYDGLRLATLLCCVGAANALANPKRALRVLPGALYELGVSVIVSLTVAPQLVESAQRVRRARRLRGGDGREGLRMLHTIALPVLQDALDRSVHLAAAMDSRGYGRRAGVSDRARRTTAALLVGGLMALCVGAYGLLDGTAAPTLALPAFVLGAGLCGAGLLIGSRRVRVSTYRGDPWRASEWIVSGCGLAAAAVLVVGARYDVGLNPSSTPLAWPTLPPLPVAGILLGALAGLAAPAVAAPTAAAPTVTGPPAVRGDTPRTSPTAARPVPVATAAGETR